MLSSSAGKLACCRRENATNDSGTWVRESFRHGVFTSTLLSRDDVAFAAVSESLLQALLSVPMTLLVTMAASNLVHDAALLASSAIHTYCQDKPYELVRSCTR